MPMMSVVTDGFGSIPHAAGGDNSAQPAGAAPAGWYPDPGAPGHQRWWDGTQWTAHSSANYPLTHIPPKPSRKTLWITLGAIGGAIALFLGFGFVLLSHDRSGAKKAVTAYLNNLEAGNYTAAYDELCVPDQSVVSLQQFDVSKAAEHPVSFAIDRVFVHARAGSATTAQVFYNETESNGEDLVSEISAVKTNGTWQVCHSVPGSAAWNVGSG